MGSQSVYVSSKDTDTLSKNTPTERTFNQYLSDILHEKAEFIRSTTGADGVPKIPEYERQ